MSRSQAVRSGFSAVFRQPLVFAAELSWRWAFLVAAWMLGIYAILMFAESLPVSDRDMFGLFGIIPGTAKYALASIFRGSGPTMVKIIVSLAVGLGVMWWLAASAGRLAVLRALMPGSEGRLSDMLRINGARVLLAFIAAFAYVGAIALAGAYSQEASGARDAAKFRLVFWPVVLVISMAWSWLSWYLTLAPIVSVARATSPRESVIAAAEIAHVRGWQFAWVSFVFGFARLAQWTMGFFILFFVLSLALQFPGAAAFIPLIFFAAVYSFLYTFLQTARMAAYVRIVQWQP